jgi:prevent-host-death family protein
MTKILQKIIGLRELREDTETYIEGVKKGKSFTVVRKSTPIFKIVPVDVWGDDGEWETIADFRKINKGKGVPAEEVIKALWSLK